MSKRLTAQEAAKICNVPYSTFHRWCKEGVVTECTLEQSEHKRGCLKGRIYMIGKRFKVKLPYTEETLKRAVPR